MKKFITVVALAVWAMLGMADYLDVGISGEITGGGIIKGIVLASTNASETATISAVYSWPVYGEQTEQKVETVSYPEVVDKVETLTNWCDYVTASAVTNVSGSVTNVVYYDGINVSTSAVLQIVRVQETNTVTKIIVIDNVVVTNTLYELTADDGIATSTEKKCVGAGARLLVEDAPVTVIWE